MPDISMCKGGECPLKETCYRYTAMPGERQSYFLIPPFRKGGACDYFWYNNENKKKREDEK